jgi:3-phytase
MRSRWFFVALIVVLLAAVAVVSWYATSTKTGEPEAPEPTARTGTEPTRAGATPPDPEASPGSGGVALPERYCVDAYAADNIDSVTIWPRRSWVIATAKEGNRLLVFNLADGSLVREVTGGQQRFRRPNGIAIIDDRLLVVERDNRQVRVLTLPEFETVSTFGDDVLRRPYGLAVFTLEATGAWELYVTDSYETPEETVPPPAELDERVRHFRVDPQSLQATLVRSFGETDGPGVLQTVESIAADVAGRRLLIADETTNELKVYGLDGRFLDEIIGSGQLVHQAEGIALATCNDRGYWVATDQGDARTRFVIFDRGTGEVVGNLFGYTVANTDGIALSTASLDGFPSGALVAVHDDQGFCVFDWLEVAESTSLDWKACTEAPSKGRDAPSEERERPRAESDRV